MEENGLTILLAREERWLYTIRTRLVTAARMYLTTYNR